MSDELRLGKSPQVDRFTFKLRAYSILFLSFYSNGNNVRMKRCPQRNGERPRRSVNGLLVFALQRVGRSQFSTYR